MDAPREFSGTTPSGFAFTVPASALNNMELMDMIADVEGERPELMGKLLAMLLGKEQRAKLYDHLRTESGIVPLTAVLQEVTAIFETIGSAGKN